jgi:hypothetical protein
LKTKALLNPNSKTIHFGRPVEFLDLESRLHKWVEEMRQEYIPVRTNNIIAQAISLGTTNTFKKVLKRVIHNVSRGGYIAFLSVGTCLSAE